MGDDSIILHLYHGGKFVKERKLKYEGGSCRIIEPIDVDRSSYFELKGTACEEIGYAGLLDFPYVIPSCSMESGLGRLFTDEESVEMLKHYLRLESPLTWNDIVDRDVGSSDDDSDYHPNGEDDDDSESNWVGEEAVIDELMIVELVKKLPHMIVMTQKLKMWKQVIMGGRQQSNKLENLGNRTVTF
ncbi:hypothetical protein Cgig2_012254 [Carnegiea gigantea]|uniref:PB1-like domain-containing protein n=1 Tax=Carnegiea gigantea TaxID=171969 RepID=A0A9Q1Q4M3_9CARY|nr:hypothetical protein Cgig2_012254 [Carnegiea gigantea]